MPPIPACPPLPPTPPSPARPAAAQPPARRGRRRARGRRGLQLPACAARARGGGGGRVALRGRRPSRSRRSPWGPPCSSGARASRSGSRSRCSWRGNDPSPERVAVAPGGRVGISASNAAAFRPRASPPGAALGTETRGGSRSRGAFRWEWKPQRGSLGLRSASPPSALRRPSREPFGGAGGVSSVALCPLDVPEPRYEASLVVPVSVITLCTGAWAFRTAGGSFRNVLKRLSWKHEEDSRVVTYSVLREAPED